MNFDFIDRRSAEHFAELLEDTAGSRRRHTRGPADEDMAELVTIGHRISAAKPGVRVDPEFRLGLRAMLVATAERDGLGRTAEAIEAEPVATRAATVKSDPRSGIFGGGGRRIRVRGLIVVGVAASAMAVSGISAASEGASPGDALYGVKRSTERAQLAMAGSDVTRGQLSLDFARTRLAEAASMPGGAADFGNVMDDMDADTRKGVKLLNTSAVARKDVKPLTAVDSFVGAQRLTLTPVLDKLTPVNRQRAMASIGLLEDVHQRAEDLRRGLACSTMSSAGSDTLGPKLHDCAIDPNGASTPARKPVRSGKSAPKQNSKNAKVNPAATSATTKPAVPGGKIKTVRPTSTPTSGTNVVPPDAVTPVEPPGPTTDPTTDGYGYDDEGDLGGWLGGDLLGGHSGGR